MEKEKDEKKKTKIILLLIIAIIIVAVVGYINTRSQNKVLKHDDAAIVMDNPSGEYVTVPGFTRLCFKAGEIYQPIVLSNPAGNSAEMTVSIAVEGNMIYESGLISPSEFINEIKISKTFDAGSYDCIIIYQFYRNDAPLNGAKNKCKLEVYE